MFIEKYQQNKISTENVGKNNFHENHHNSTKKSSQSDIALNYEPMRIADKFNFSVQNYNETAKFS